MKREQGGLGVAANVELLVSADRAIGDGCSRESKRLCDGLVIYALRRRAQHLHLSLGQALCILFIGPMSEAA
jgi:hypothetical protein